MESVENKLAHCRSEITDELRGINTMLSRAFPRDAEGNIDIDGHRSYHENLILAAKAQARFWEEMRLDLAKKGMWGLLIIIIGLLIVGIQAKLGMINVPKVGP